MTVDSRDKSSNVQIAVLTVSDKGFKGLREDRSGAVIADLINELAPPLGRIISRTIVPDERDMISKELKRLSDDVKVDLIITTGGTGFGPRDVTPEATSDVIERQVPGFPEAMRIESLKYTPLAMLSRGISGIRGQCLIINLPGSPKGVRENLQAILPALPHGMDILRQTSTECGSEQT